jgi:RNA polymerase sigma-70 factor (ECF subfamily)
LRDVHAEDLYLACAGLSGDEAALKEIRNTYHPAITKALKRVGAIAICEEVEQRLWERLFLGGNQGPRLGTYSGRGPLGFWIGISAQRLAVTTLRHEQAESRARHQATAHLQVAVADPEMAALRHRYRARLQEAVNDAVTSLDDRDKMLYQMHLVEGLTLERIAVAYGVRHPTILRWLDKARRKVLNEAKRRLRESLRISSGEFDSIAGLLAGELDLEISRVLSKPP